MSEVHPLCYSCGEAVDISQPRCPHCGVRIADSDANTDAMTGWMGDTMVGAPASLPSAAEEISETLIGETLDVYRIERLLGRGGMAFVFLAEHKNLHRPCALKVLCPEFQGRQADSIDLFLAEARSAASVVHPHIVTVHNVGEAEGRHYIELEYVEGSALDDVHSQGRLDDLEIIALMTQATSALSAAHDRGLVHRDFKPANIMISERGQAKLADFGLAKQLRDVAGRESLAGTPYYMAPELFQGAPATTASDVYAFGVSMYRLLARRYPFHHGDWTELAKLHVDAPPPRLIESHPHLDSEIIGLVDHCLAKKPDDRPRDGGLLHDNMQRIYRSMRDLKGLIQQAFAGDENVSWVADGSAYVITVQLPEGRRQRVTIEETATEISPLPLVRIFTICSPVRDDYLRKALELNAQMPHGALSIQDVGGEDFFVMVNNYPRSTCDLEEIHHSVLDLARWGDAVELALGGEDRF